MFKFFKEKAPTVQTSKEAGVLKTLALLTLFMSSCSEKGIPAAEKQEKFKDYYEALDKAGGFVPFELDNGLGGTFETAHLNDTESGYAMSLRQKESVEAQEKHLAGVVSSFVTMVDSNSDGTVDFVMEQKDNIVKWEGGNRYISVNGSSNETITDPEVLAKAQETYSTLLPEVARQANLYVEKFDKNGDGQLNESDMK